MSTNELTLTRELHKIQKFVNVGNKKIENRYALTALLLALNDHVTRIWQAIEEVRDVHSKSYMDGPKSNENDFFA
jgi:hypothetical protein